MEAITRDLLTLSGLEKQPESVVRLIGRGSIRNVLLAATKTCERKAANKQIELSVNCADDLVAPMSAPLLELAIVNLIDNALNHTDSGGGILITATRERGHALISVRDWGCGIESRHLSRIFERFEKARSRNLGGTGSGLAIVKRIVLAHAGKVEVESRFGKGSEFSILIPLLKRPGNPFPTAC